jgi:hypothetical protein
MMNATTHNQEPRLAIFYEHPAWFTPLFAELDRRGVAYEKDVMTQDNRHALTDPPKRTVVCVAFVRHVRV